MIKIGNVSTGINDGASSLTISHVVANNNNRILIVGVAIEDATAGDRVVSGITYNGVALTRINFVENVGLTGNRSELWYLLAPSVGTFNVVVTMGGTCTNLNAGVIDIYDAMQIAPEANGTDTGTTVVSEAITTLSGQALLVMVATGNTTTAFTHGAGQTERWNVASSSSRGTGSTEFIVSGSLQTQTETQSDASRVAGIVASFVSIHQPGINDVVSIAEYLDLYLTVLNIDILDPFHVVITEHADVLDLVVEVGIVMEAIYVTDIDEASLDVLNTDIYDAILATEISQEYLDILYASVYDDSTVSDDIQTIIDVLNVDVYDSTSSIEYAEADTTKLINVADDIGITMHAELLPDVLFAFVIDPFHVLITEHAQILDLIIEVGVVMEAIYVTDIDDARFDVLNINEYDIVTISEHVIAAPEPIPFVADLIAITEAVAIVPDPISNIYDDIAISEYVDNVISVECIVYDDIATQEATVLLRSADIDVAESIYITETAYIIDLVVEIGPVVDVAAITEDVTTTLTDLFINRDDAVTVTEYADILDLVIDLPELYDAIAIAEYATVFDIIIELYAYDDISVTFDITVVDLVIELYVEDNIGVADISIMPFGVGIGDDVGVTGALTDYVTITDTAAILIAELFATVYDEIATAEYADILDIIIDVDVVFDNIVIAEIALADLVIEAIAEDAILASEWVLVGFPINLTVEEIIALVDVLGIEVLTWDLYPRIFEVTPRQRIFTIDKTRYGYSRYRQEVVV